MQPKRVLALGALLTLVVAGAWLLLRPTALTPESVAGYRARTAGLAPSGLGDRNAPLPEGVIDLGKGAYRFEPVSPSFVNMSSLPRRTSSDNSQYNRWLRGEIDLDENESILSEVEMQALRDAAQSLPPGGTIENLSLGSAAPEPAGTAFDSMDFTESSGGYVPPDPEMSAGPDHLIAVVNVSVEIYDKDGNSLVGPTDLNDFFQSLPGTACEGSFDPNTLYDEREDRFIVAADGNGTNYCIGVSQTGDPTGDWNLYQFPTNVAGNFYDYPHSGVGNDAIYVGSNQFSFQFEEGRVWAYEKAAMYAGDPASGVSQTTGPDDTPQPLKLHGWDQGTWPTDGPHYFITSRDYNGETFAVYAWEDPFGANDLSVINVVDLPAYHGVTVGLPVNNDQSGSGQIQGNDYRPLDFEYRNGSGWTAMTVSCNPGGGTVNCLQWGEIDIETGELIQAGVASSTGDYRYFPDVAANDCGDMAIGYTQSDAASFPSVYVSGREEGDPLGTLGDELLVKAGEVTYTAFDGSPHRWGDYTGMTIDPDGQTFWYLGEYSKNITSQGRWGNWIGSFQYPSCASGGGEDFDVEATPRTQAVCVPDDAVYTVEVESINGFNDVVTLSTQGEPPNSTTSFSVNGGPAPYTSELTVDTTASTPAGTYDIDIIGVAASGSQTTTVELEVYNGAPDAPTLINPADGATNVPTTPTFSWTPLPDATGYLIEIATDAGFTNIVDSATVTEPTYTPADPLPANTTLYWRVTAANLCGEGATSEVFSFTTFNAICSAPSLPIPDADPDGVSDDLVVGEGGTINDLNLSLNIPHTYVGDLVITLEKDGNVVGIIDQPPGNGSCSGNDINALFDDEAGSPAQTSCTSATGLTTGPYSPLEELSAFDGESLAGTWTLTVSDLVGQDLGTLEEWCLLADATPPTAVTVGALGSAAPSNLVPLAALALLGLVGAAMVLRHRR